MDQSAAWLLSQGALGLICLFLGFLLWRSDKRENLLQTKCDVKDAQILVAIEARIAVGLTAGQTIEANTRTMQAFSDRFTQLLNLVETLQREIKDMRYKP